MAIKLFKESSKVKIRVKLRSTNQFSTIAFGADHHQEYYRIHGCGTHLKGYHLVPRPFGQAIGQD